MRPQTLGLTFFLLVQALPVDAKSPSIVAADVGPIAFKQTKFEDVRAGYVSLEWNDVLEKDSLAGRASEATYVVSDDDGTMYYHGHLPMAFVSGLPDGDYRFHIGVVGADGEVLATSDEPAVVQVEHWSLTQALSLFTIGLIVFLILIGLITHGAIRSRRPRPVPGDLA